MLSKIRHKRQSKVGDSYLFIVGIEKNHRKNQHETNLNAISKVKKINKFSNGIVQY